jgi:hypothetical protein
MSAVSPDELTEIASRLRFRQIVGIVAGVVLIVWMVVFVLLSTSLVGTSNHTGQLAERSDCKTQYSSILGAPVQTRDNLTSQVASISADLQSQLGSALLAVTAGQNPTAADVVLYETTKHALDAERAQLKAAIIAVDQEPTLNAATVKGFRLDGVTYPACPKVG